MKYNLADVIALDSYSNILSIIEYETISGTIKEMENSLALVTLLQTIKENSPLFRTFISTEIGFLQDAIENNQNFQEKTSEAVQAINNCVFLSKLKNIFEDTAKIEHIIVYNSLTESIPETKAVEYFNEEMITLRNIVREEIRALMSKYQSITRDDANFQNIKNVSYSLSKLVIRLNKLSKDTMRKSASSFLSQKNLEDQFAFFNLFFQEHVPNKFNNVPNLISHQNNNKLEADIIDAEVNDVKIEAEQEENTESQNTNQEYIEEFKQSLQEVIISVEKISKNIQSIKDENLEMIQQSLPKNIDEDEIVEKIVEKIKHSLYAHNEENEQKSSLLHKRVELIDEKISDISNVVRDLSANFNDFIENQINFTKLIKERYNISI